MFPNDTRILVIDDLKTVRTLLKDILNELGYTDIDEAADGNEAEKKLLKSIQEDPPYGLIVADWNLPGRTGIDLLELRNSEPQLKHTPFLMITIESEREYVLKAVSMGVNDFIVKPFNKEIIESKIKSIWDRLQEYPTGTNDES